MRAVLTALMCLVASVPGEPQILESLGFGGPPQVAVTLKHPPEVWLSVDSIAFARSEGKCSNEFVDALISLAVHYQVDVIDRQHLEALLEEHKLSASGLVDPETAAELGKILGPVALVFVTVRRCETDRERDDDYSVRSNPTYVSRTKAFFNGSIQIVDLGTARVHSALAIDETASRENRSEDRRPPHPSKYEVRDDVLRMAVRRVQQRYFPWTERRLVAFYDHKNCNLRLAYRLIQAGDYDAALAQSRANLDACKAHFSKKPKLLSRAYYNLGIAHFLVGDHSAAMDNLAESLRLRPAEATSAAMAECRRAVHAAAERKRYEAQFASQESQLKGKGPEEGGEGIEDRLQKLKELYDSGLISKQDYDRKVKEILEEL